MTSFITVEAPSTNNHTKDFIFNSKFWGSITSTYICQPLLSVLLCTNLYTISKSCVFTNWAIPISITLYHRWGHRDMVHLNDFLTVINEELSQALRGSSLALEAVWAHPWSYTLPSPLHPSSWYITSGATTTDPGSTHLSRSLFVRLQWELIFYKVSVLKSTRWWPHFPYSVGSTVGQSPSPLQCTESFLCDLSLLPSLATCPLSLPNLYHSVNVTLGAPSVYNDLLFLPF